jgi:hypothetical protein
MPEAEKRFRIGRLTFGGQVGLIAGHADRIPPTACLCRSRRPVKAYAVRSLTMLGKIYERWGPCGGSGNSGATFKPHIQVIGSLRSPASVIAAITGAPWKFIEIPEDVLERDEEAQRAWVSWRVRQHFQESKGKCRLFGYILAYRWKRSEGESIALDTQGRVIETKRGGI